MAMPRFAITRRNFIRVRILEFLTVGHRVETRGMTEPETPKDLARELGITPQAIRTHLRAEYGRLGPFATRWHLTPERAEKARSHFLSRAK